MRRIRFVPLAALLGALTLLCALPALASAATVENENEAEQGIGTGPGNGGCSSEGVVNVPVSVGSQCGNSGGQNAEQDIRDGNGIIQQCQALRDCNQQAIQQEINNNRFTTNTTRQAGPGGAAAQDGAETQGAAATQGSSQGTQATAVHSADTPSSAAVREVTLARTGFDAWILFVVGGASVAGGLGLLAVRRWNLRGLLGRGG